ncbi:MAG: methylmalonyl-CoA mutase family protein, partial [Calditrichaceae bacterium]
IENGFIQREIQNAAYRYQQEVEKTERIVVGVNQFKLEDEPIKEILKVDPRLREVQTEKLQKLKRTRDNQKVENILEELKNAAKDEKTNLMPFILTAAKSYATLGEICGILRDIFGEYRETVVL